MNKIIMLGLLSIVCLAVYVSASGYTSEQASHDILYTNQINSKTDAPVSLGDGIITGMSPIYFLTGPEDPNYLIQSGEWDDGMKYKHWTSHQFYTSGSERVRIASNGNVGIGTATPETYLDVYGGLIQTNLAMRVKQGMSISSLGFSGSNGGYLLLEDLEGNVDVLLTADGDSTFAGNVGIGTDIPTQKLDVEGNIRFNPTISTPGRMHIHSETEDIYLLANGGDVIVSDAWGGAGNLIASGTICDINGCIGAGGADTDWTVNGTNVYREIGNVGIGTITPDNKLEVNGAIEIQVEDADSKLRFHDPNNAWYSLGIDVSDGRKFKINPGGDVGETNGLVMDTAGSVGIGTTAPTAKLDVQGNLKVVNHYFDANDDSWLRIRASDGGAYKDLAVGQLYSATGITLGDVHRNSWPSGCELAWVGSTSDGFVPMSVPARCSSGCELKIFYTPYTGGVSAVTYLRYSGNTWISEIGGGTNGDTIASPIASLGRLWLYDDYSATETSSTQWTVRTQTGITGYIYAC